MPQKLRIVITREVKQVDVRDPVSGEISQVDVTYSTYRLAFGGRLICREIHDKNLLKVAFGAYQFSATYHPEVVYTCQLFEFLPVMSCFLLFFFSVTALILYQLCLSYVLAFILCR